MLPAVGRSQQETRLAFDWNTGRSSATRQLFIKHRLASRPGSYGKSKTMQSQEGGEEEEAQMTASISIGMLRAEVS